MTKQLFSICLFLFSLNVFAKDYIYTGYFSNFAISGYDAVSYFTENKPIEGEKKHSYSWKGAQWLFSSKKNLVLFKSSPNKYAPQYGGYCAYAVANNYTASGDPHAWTIHKNKLYLNYNESVKQGWLKQKEKYIADGDKNWPKVLDK